MSGSAVGGSSPEQMVHRTDRALVLFLVPVAVILIMFLVALTIYTGQAQRSSAHCVELHRQALRRDIANLIRDPHHAFPPDDGIHCSATP